ncbi:MAG: hypothetical protein Q4A83_04625 [Bacillota bacterium]|nr:hypothetical protein [Bacillota bacterium]
MFEEGEATLTDGIMQLMMGMQPSFHPYSHEQVTDSLAERLAGEFGIEIPDLYVEDCDANAGNDPINYDNCINQEAYADLCNAVLEKLLQTDENGDYVCAKRDGKVLTLIDLDKCDLVVSNAKEYLEESEADTYGEVIPRIASYALVAIAAVLGAIAGLMGLVAGITGGKKTGKGLGIAAAIMAVGGFVAAIISHYTDFVYGIRVDDAGAYATEMGNKVIYSGEEQKPIFLAMVIATILFVIAAAIAKKAAKEKASKEAVAAEASDAAVAGAADAERVAKLEAENAELKAMVAEMAADAATVKD